MRTRIDFDLENVQRAAQLRRLGRDLHDQAAAISVATVESVAAVVSRLAASTDYGDLVGEGFRRGDGHACSDLTPEQAVIDVRSACRDPDSTRSR